MCGAVSGRLYLTTLSFFCPKTSTQQSHSKPPDAVCNRGTYAHMVSASPPPPHTHTGMHTARACNIGKHDKVQIEEHPGEGAGGGRSRLSAEETDSPYTMGTQALLHTLTYTCTACGVCRGWCTSAVGPAATGCTPLFAVRTPSVCILLLQGAGQRAGSTLGSLMYSCGGHGTC